MGVKKLPSQEVKKSFLLNHIIEGLTSGKYPTKLASELSISKQNINYYIRQLKKEGIIEKKGFGVWEVKKVVKKSTKDTNPTSKNSRGHAFIWRVKLPRSWDIKSLLETKGLEYKKVGLKETPRILINNKKVWLGKKSIVVYDSSSFYGSNAIESKKYAVESLLEVLRTLESRLSINLKPYLFTTSRQHFALIKNELAIQCNRQNERIHIYDKGERWLLVDDSLGDGGELENEGKQALPINVKLQSWWNEQKDTKFEVTPTFILKTMNGIQQNQKIFAENMKSHINAINELANAVKELKGTIKRQ